MNSKIKELIKECVELGITLHWHGNQNIEGSMGVYNIGHIGLLLEWPDNILLRKLQEGIIAYKEVKGIDPPAAKYKSYYEKILHLSKKLKK